MNRLFTLLLAAGTLFYSTVFAQNVGVGTPNPQYKLDVNGRMRLMHANAQTAGLWLDGPSNPTRSFIGTLNENYMGIYGNAGAGWNLVMNVINGNTGIGTTTPTATLDVDGTIRYRSGGSYPASQLISSDNNGNMVWQMPVSFAVSGLADGADVTSSLTKLYFSSIPEYNYGFSYFPGSSTFEVSVKGIYHLDVLLNTYFPGQTNESGTVRLYRIRNSISTILAKCSHGHIISEPLAMDQTFQISGDFLLEPGDVIYLDFQGTHSWLLKGNAESARFSGRLVQRVF